MRGFPFLRAVAVKRLVPGATGKKLKAGSPGKGAPRDHKRGLAFSIHGALKFGLALGSPNPVARRSRPGLFCAGGGEASPRNYVRGPEVFFFLGTPAGKIPPENRREMGRQTFVRGPTTGAALGPGPVGAAWPGWDRAPTRASPPSQ